MLVFVPVASADLAAWASGEVLSDADAFAPTAAFLDAFGLSAPDEEDAERTLTYLAGLGALQRHGHRLVAVAEAPLGAEGDDEWGRVRVSLPFSHVSALFADDPDAAAQVASVRAVVQDLSFDEAWSAPAHERLLADADLMWFGPEEWSQLVG